MKTIMNILNIVTSCVIAFSACKKKEQEVTPPVPGNEFLTTVKVRFQNSANSADTLWAIWRDLTPDDQNPPDTSKAIINLKRKSTYHSRVRFYDETKNPPEDLTIEVLERANFHSYWFFKSPGISAHLTITPTDHDTNNPPFPLGLENDFVTDSVLSAGRLEGILRHQPSGKDGTFTPGTTDSDVFFTLSITP